MIFNLGAAAPMLTALSVTTAPAREVYNTGAAFNPAGMVVTATYSDGSCKAVTGYTYSPATITAAGNVTVSYTENGVTETAQTPVAMVLNDGPSWGNRPL